MHFGYFLYTGKICYLIDELKKKEKPNYVLQLIIGYLGNVVGAFAFGLINKAVLTMPEFVQPMIDSKVNDSWYGLIIKGVFCALVTACLYLVVYSKNPYMKKVLKNFSNVVKLKRT